MLVKCLNLSDADVTFYPGFFSPEDASRVFVELRDTTTWRQESAKLYGRMIRQPRLTAWYGDEGKDYSYSGINNVALPWTSALLEVKQLVEPACGMMFNSVLLNRYRTGKDSVSWHSDDEPAFGDQPVIASVSFGATRTFQLKHKSRNLKASIELTHGSLLIMCGSTQTNWRHQVPKTTKPVDERINLTFRMIITRTH